jgi:UDP-N-acetylmuramoyl-tripeptide--D-alanyl-D-alanine ligase
MRFQAAEIARATGGEVAGPDVEVEGASHDSRALVPGQLFVPVVDVRDGHQFVAAALAAGAPAYLSAQGHLGATAVLVDDTEAALTRLGAAARDRLPDAVVGITGSVGKTSVKDLTAAAVGGGLRVSASERSFNNDLGVPLTLLQAPDDVQAVVVEMGARGLGHIGRLAEVARPTVGVVTAVERVHTEVFGTVDDVAVGKGELVEALPASGTAVLNAEDVRVAAMAHRTSAAVLTYGIGVGDVRAEHVRLDAQLRPAFTLVTPDGSLEVRLEVRGVHNAANAAAAAAVALALGVGLPEAVEGLAEASLSPWRMELVQAPSGALVLNDAYNANPASMRAALRSLAELPALRRTAVLGVMAELGTHHDEEHQAIGNLAAELGVRVISVADPGYGSEVEVVPDLDAAAEALGDLSEGDAVLVKGSRVAGLEHLAQTLLQG